MRPEYAGIVQRLREQLRVTEAAIGTEPLPKRWVELIVLLNEREKAARNQKSQ